MHAADLSPVHFLWRVDGKVATVTLNRPERKNPLSLESYAELRDTFRALGTATDVKAVVLGGAGGNFSSGGDVRDIIGKLVQMDLQGKLEFTRMTGDLVKAMRACPQPIIAAIDGVCAGAGAMLALASDIRLGTAASKVAFLFTRVGLAGSDMGACAMLPRVVGHGRAAELLYTGRNISGEEAERIGLYSRLIEPDQLQEEAHRLAQTLADGPTFAHAFTKRQLHKEWDMGLDEAIESEAQAQAICMDMHDFERAYEAFIDKRKPEFRGD
jgi:enoyl-CoA hydratase/carnithine racemase